MLASMPTSFPVSLSRTDIVTALIYTGEEAVKIGATLILGHGAGAGQTSPFMVSFGSGLAALGLDVITFNFPYAERGRRAPDRGPSLEACYRSVVETARAAHPSVAKRPLLIGGKSMGGRIASQIAAVPANDTVKTRPDLDIAGLVLLGYPLHPPGKPDRMRNNHLHRIGVPMLIVQGSRDSFGTPNELRPVLAQLSEAQLHVVDGGDHSFNLRRKSAPSQEQIHAAVVNKVIRWVQTITRQAEV